MCWVALLDWGRRRRTSEVVQVEPPLLPVHYRLASGQTTVSGIHLLRVDIDGQS
jgi:hypothetical protein